MTKQELDQLEREMLDHYGRNDVEATNFAFGAIIRLLQAVRELRAALAKQSVPAKAA